MADEIVITSERRLTNGRRSFELLFFYPITPPIRTHPNAGAATIVPTPALTLETDVVNNDLVDAARLVELDAGATLFLKRGLTRERGEAAGAFLARVRDAYNADDPVAELRLSWQNAGRRLNA